MRLPSSEVTTTALPTESSTRSAVTTKIRVASDNVKRGLVAVATLVVRQTGLVEMGGHARLGDLELHGHAVGVRHLERQLRSVGLLVPHLERARSFRQI